MIYRGSNIYKKAGSTLTRWLYEWDLDPHMPRPDAHYHLAALRLMAGHVRYSRCGRRECPLLAALACHAPILPGE